MLRTEHSLPSSNYFLDNGKLVFDLYVAIEGLVFTDGIPTEGNHYEAPDGTHVWTVLEHVVVYRIVGERLLVDAVMPVL